MNTTKTVIAVIGLFLVVNLIGFSNSRSHSKYHPYKGVFRELLKVNIFTFILAAITFAVYWFSKR